MRFTLYFKTPDVLDQLHDRYKDEEFEEMKNFVRKFIKYEECATVEFDTEKGTATLLKVR